MSGVMEQILAELQKQTAILQGIASTGNAPQVAGGIGTERTVPQGATTTGGASAASATGVVTSDDLLALVQPLVQNEVTKAQVKDVLTKYGLNRLGEAKPEQYASLQAEFKAIAGGGAVAQADDGLI